MKPSLDFVSCGVSVDTDVVSIGVGAGASMATIDTAGLGAVRLVLVVIWASSSGVSLNSKLAIPSASLSSERNR